MKKILLLCNNASLTSLSIVKSLKLKNVPVKIILNSKKGPLTHSKNTDFLVMDDAFSEPNEYLEFLKNIPKEKDEFIIYITNDSIFELVSKNKKELEKYFIVPIPEWETTKKCVNKSLTYQIASKINVPTPTSFKINSYKDYEKIKDNVIYPSIIKPDSSEIKKKIGVPAIEVKNIKQLNFFLKALSKRNYFPINIQEIIPGPPDRLYTLGSIFDFDNNPASLFTGKKIRQSPIDYGVCTIGVSKWYPKVAELGIKLLKEIGFYGISQVEFKLDYRDGKFKLMEINPRPWLWILLATYCGLNLPYIYYKIINGEKIHPMKYRENIKWHRLTTDIRLVIKQIHQKHEWFNFRSILKSLNGNRIFPTLSLNDPGPFIYEIKNVFV